MPKQKATSFAEDLAAVQASSFSDDLASVGNDAPRSAKATAPSMGPLHDIGAGVLRLAKKGYGYATNKPEDVIDIAGPVAGAALGASIGAGFGGVGAVPGALIGAGAGYLYGKANRASSNAATGKPITRGMPQTAGDWGWDVLENVGGNVAPDVAIPAVAKGLMRGGRRLVSGALRPPLSSVNDMVEMGARGTMPQDVRSNIAQDLIDTANEAGLWSPVSDANARRVVGKLQKTHDANTALVQGAGEAGQTLNMAPVYGEAGGFAEKSVKGGFTPSSDLQSVRGRIKAYLSDPESKLTVPYEKWDTDTALSGMLPETTSTVSRTRIPNMQADPMDALKARRMLGGELRGTYGLDASQRASQVMDKAVYRSSGDALKDIAPGLREGMDQEHRLMNAAQSLVPTEYLAGNQKPINLYTFLGLAGGDPATVALGISNYPAVQAMIGKGVHNMGARAGGTMGLPLLGGAKVSPTVQSNLLRAALMRQLMSGAPPE